MATGNYQFSFKLGKYRLNLEDFLGKGQFGIVYEGRDSVSGLAVAVKKIQYRERGQPVNEVLFEMGNTESQIFKKLKTHKNIVQLIEHIDDGKSHWLVMEFCDGGDLVKYFNSNPVDFHVKVKVISECSNAIAFMHKFNPPIVHRDIKPTNVLIKRQNNEDIAKITDFGIGKLFEDRKTAQLTMTTLGGTANFMAPEFFDGGYLKYQPGVDTFSLGLLFHVILMYGQDEISKEMTPQSKQSRRTETNFNFGWEIVNSAKLHQRLPELSSLRNSDDPDIKQLTDMIDKMTEHKEEDRMPLMEVNNICLQVFCNSLQSKLADKTAVVASMEETMDAYRQQTGQLTRKTEELNNLQHVHRTKQQQLQDLEEVNRILHKDLKESQDRMQTNDQELQKAENELQILRQELQSKQIDESASELKQKIPIKSAVDTNLTATGGQADLTVVKPKAPSSTVVKSKASSPLKPTQGQKKSGAEVETDWTSVRSFRFSDRLLGSVMTHKLEKVKTTKVKYAFRLCLHKGQVWIPCSFDNTIQVLSLDGTVIQDIPLTSVDTPRSLHPITSDQLVLAARSGIYILDNKANIKATVHKGRCDDISVYGNLVAGLCDGEGGTMRLYIWDHGKKFQLIRTFSVTVDTWYFNKVIIDDNCVYVSDQDNNTIHKYSLHGESLGRFGGFRVKLSEPRLCMSDEQHNLLVAEWGNKTAAVVSQSNDLVTRVPVDGNPVDLVIHQDKLLVLSGDPLTSNLSIYKLI